MIRGGKRGYERLQVLARSWLPTTSALLDRVRPGPGMSCLDLGCGGGDVTFELARRVGPGIASADQLRAALDSLNEFAADPASVCGSPRLFQAWSRRPMA